VKVIVNGQAHSVANPQTIDGLVQELKLIPETLLIEHNGRALHRREWQRRAVQDGDKIELIRVVAGG
jgi:thiamine biosynthesis protein ThiS